ncbi:MAG: bifunctional (p)ppGpp synthetase/guanosine-3',5'-bis(diphosphate) 3'-pyrophosphohydrolase [Acidobacteriota bacterium]|nr:bifunctional (p)ppGpp synthetase/guanosine-3',5'-bis(diphosphate) 3'-pyrophosphohydrolase [Blastocatellia bacterium]MDW8240110.1 bifunctional (p)ppGpp synthetase/guanosine-3',5'-bis(diphosphate) 3'-pyrophosphohydrolase [Acidobacteriota bacterium]
MIRFDDIVEKVRQYHPSADEELLRRAYLFSAIRHRGQTRKSGEPYLVHPLEVAYMLAEMKLDVVCVATGLLHDVVEDTNTTVEEIERYFGPDIAHLVDGLTKLGQLNYETKQQRQAESMRKMLLAMTDDIRIILVKLADRLNNMRTLTHLSREKQVRIAQETLEVYAPIAHRLGMGRIRGELEDLAFRYLHPEDYQRIRDALSKRRQGLESALDTIKKKISTQLTENSVPYVDVQGRVKRLYSIYLKMKRQKITLEQIYDLIAIRIITSTVRDCYAALGVIHTHWTPVPGRFKDWVATPRENMYQSIHTSVIAEGGQAFEVQIRTEEMHQIAEEGIAAHWKYKEGKRGYHQDDATYKWLRQLVEWQQDVKDPGEFLDSLKLDLYPKEVFAFTPKGKVIELPRGATPVDFAYAIHSEVGHTCTGAKVNGRLVPLRYQIRNGDVVEIITTPGHTPSRDWLKFVTTNRAANRIRKWLREQERVEAIELGKKIVEKEASRYKLSLKKILLANELLQKIASEHGYGRVDDLFASVGYGKTPARTIITRFVPSEMAPLAEEKAASKLDQVAQVVKKALRLGDEPIRVKGADDLMVYRAQCCNPIRGEPVIGYITRGKGVAVHARRCTNVPSLTVDRERIIDVDWIKGENGLAYPVSLKILIDDRQGALADVTQAIAAIKTNIRDAHAGVNSDGRGELRFTVEITDLKHLQRVIKAIQAIAGVIDVERID